MATFQEQYQAKLTTPDEAVKVVKDGDWIYYGEFVTITPVLDAALARRKNELHDIHVETCTLKLNTAIYQADPDREVFDIDDRSLTAQSRRQSAYHIPGTYEEFGRLAEIRKINVAFIATCPMDEHGFFNTSTTCSYIPSVLESADYVIIEENEAFPHVYGGDFTAIHISQVHAIVKGNGQPLESLPKGPASDVDTKIAENVMKELEDGCCLQLGIGGIPDKIGEAIVNSDIKDLGVHTEMMMDSFMSLYKAGKVTNRCKQINKGKMVFTFAMGSTDLYEFLDKNENCLKFPASYTNDPFVIMQNDKVFGVNNCLHIDLYTQVSSESVGPKQISGVGGQWDFIYGAFRSKGGKGFVCMNSTATRKDKDGNMKVESRIVPSFAPGTNITLARFFTFYVATEYGCTNMKGLSTWQRAEEIIKLAHPDFRDGLIKDAEKFGIWRPSNKR